MRRALYTLAILILALTSCRDDDGPESVNPPVTNIVTFAGNNSEGALFTFNQINDSPMIDLQSNYRVDTETVKEGRRVLLRYIPANGEPYASTTIKIAEMALINSDTIKTGKISKYPDWNRDGIYVYSLWRTGNFINLHARLAYDESPRTFMLMLDERSADNEYPDVYIVHRLKEPANSFTRGYYASWFIGDVWNNPQCKGLNIHVANTNLTDKTIFQFKKQ